MCQDWVCGGKETAVVVALTESVDILWTRKLKLIKELCEAKPSGTERLLSELEGASTSSSPGTPIFLVPGTSFVEDKFFLDQGGVRMSQALYTYCALYVYYYYSSSTSDHLALGPRDCGPLP